MEKSIVWIVGRAYHDTEQWELLGIYTVKHLAEKRCKRRNDFYAPIPLDENLPEERATFPNIVWPNV